VPGLGKGTVSHAPLTIAVGASNSAILLLVSTLHTLTAGESAPCFLAKGRQASKCNDLLLKMVISGDFRVEQREDSSASYPARCRRFMDSPSSLDIIEQQVKAYQTALPVPDPA